MDNKIRLIDANALKEDFMNDYHNYLMESLRGNCHDTIRISNVIERIEDAPAIEATPCTFCVYNPPSSCDGKPCTICPACERSGDNE